MSGEQYIHEIKKIKIMILSSYLKSQVVKSNRKLKIKM